VSVPTQLLNAVVPRYLALLAAFVVWIAGCSGEPVTITHKVCPFTLSPSSESYRASGGTGSVTVTTSANCSWTVQSDVYWVTVTGGSSGSGNGTITYSVATNTTMTARTALLKVVSTDGNVAAGLHQIDQVASTNLPIRGAYMFVMQVDPDGACAWPETTYYWPVTIATTSHMGDTILGSIGFPQAEIASSNTWSILAGPTLTQLVPGEESPGRREVHTMWW
jgi:hypothetical protein